MPLAQVMIVCSHVPALRPVAILLSAGGRPPGAVAEREALTTSSPVRA
jgi:hypothetical protein